MTKLAYLNEPGVLNNLQERYLLDDIYTYTGTILIAINPFQSLAHLYGPQMMLEYKGVDLGELSPHVYAISDNAFRQMCKARRSQSILVSGESGAGKTETSKLIMNYLAWMGGRALADESDGRGVEEKVLESNPLLEAFGNAKTVRNDNSSRFGKFVEIQFDGDWRISGAAIRTYLLERSRLVSINDPERNYHIFYQLCDGASTALREELFLKPAREFKYLNQSSCFELKGVDNVKEFKRTKHAMKVVGIAPDEQHNMFRVVAAVLHLGNITFAEGSEPDSSKIADKAAESHLSACAQLLGVDAEALRKALTTRTRHTFDGPIISPLPVDAATSNRDSLAKTIYSRMFDWMVDRVNRAVGQDGHAAAVVGVLDIYGFEQFQENDFEQFCINLANEKLQQHFNQHVFKMEQIEYEKEEIDWSYIEFVDNQDVLDLIEKRPGGILSILDEQCRFPTATPKDLSLKLDQEEFVKASSRFSKPKLNQTAFTIDHYAGEVTYQMDHFLEKNKDYVIAEHQELLSTADFDYIRSLFPAEVEDGKDPKASQKSKSAYQFKSVGTRFKGQLASLMETLSTMEPHYIRCVKPNSHNKPAMFEPANVLHQLRCGGVLEAVRISCAGYPSRREYAEFVDHFWHLAPELLSLSDDREIVRRLLAKINLQGYQLGKTKIFLKSGQMAVLDKLRHEVMNAAATKITRVVRGFLARRQHRHMIEAIITIQCAVRSSKARRIVREMRCQRAALVIETSFRAYVARKDFRRTRKAAIALQSAWRALVARRALMALKAESSAVIIQAAWRSYIARKEYMDHIHNIVKVQTRWRVRVAKRELRRLRKEARESTKLLKDKRTLELRVQELQDIVNTVQNQRNELKQSLKEERVQIAHLRESLAGVTAERDSLGAQLEAVSTQASQRESSLREKLESEIKILEEENSQLQEKLEEARAAKEAAERNAADSLAAAKRDLAESKQKAHASNQDLMRRLENAIKQRNDARESLTMSTERVKELEGEVERLRKSASDAAQQQAQRAAAYAATKGAAYTRDDAISRHGERHHGGQANGAVENDTDNASDGSGVTDVDQRQKELEARRQQLIKEQKLADQEKLLQCISSELGFHNKRPLAALVIFRSCLHWKSFQADRTNLFDKIIHTISMQIDNQHEDNNTLSYWLTNTVTLYHLLQKNIKAASGGSHYSSVRARVAHRSGGLFGTTRSGFSSFFSRSTAAASSGGASAAGSDASVHGGNNPAGFQQVEAKYPALLFKQQLDAFVQKIFPMLRDNVKKAITSELAACIHAPKSGSRGVTSRRGAAPPTTSASDAVHQLSSHWGNILDVFTDLLKTLKGNQVPKFLQRKLFMQLFSFVNVQLFNQLLLRRECCSFSNGEYVKRGLAELENWIQGAGAEHVGESWDELRYIRQAVDFLCIHQKPRKKLEEITNDLCPVLSIQQLYRISTMYWDDKYNTETVSHAVLAKMKQMMVDNSASSSHSFLLDDDSAIPFQQEDILTMIDDSDLYSELPLPAGLADTQSFTFLMQPAKLAAVQQSSSP